MALGGLISPTDERGLIRLPGRNSNPNIKFEQLLHTARVARLPFDKECWLNIAFFLGEQYADWDPDTDTFQRIPRRHKHLPRPVANKIQHFILDEQATLLQNKPSIDVLPASPSPQDISMSKVALSYLNWLSDDSVADFGEQLWIATLWALAGTEAYLKWIWDPQLEGGKGRGDILACSPLDIYPDPYAKRFDKCRWVIHSQFMDVEKVYDVYDIEVPPQSVQKTDPVRIALQREMGMAPVLEGAVVNELWMPPNRKHPQGLFTVWTGNHTLVQPTDYPYKHGQIPFTQIGSVPRPGTQHYTSVVSALRTPQMELNKFHAQMIQVREAFANPKWWIPTELSLEEDPDDSPRQILRGNSQGGALEPKLIMPTMMPPNDAGAWIESEMMDTAGVHDVSQGNAPGRVDSAKGLQMLGEPDEIRQAAMIKTISKSMTVGFWQQLQLAKQYGAEQLVFQSYSKEGYPEAHALMTAKIDPGMRVRITMQTGLSTSRTARTQQVMDMWAAGIIRDPENAAELLDLPISSVSPDNLFDITVARNENLEMAGGQPVLPNSWDNHDIHRREHNNYRKTMDFKMLPDSEKSKFEMHVEQHDQLQIQELGKELQIQSMAAAVASGAGFQNPQPPGPLPGQPGAAPAGQPPLAPGGGGASGGQPAPGPQANGNGGTPPPRIGQIPNEAGARPAPNLDDVRNTPQGVAHYRDVYARGIG